MLWDIYGEDDFQKLRLSYLRGASGYLLVVDGTRRATLDKALQIHQSVETALGRVPTELMLNKCDLADDWEITPEIEQDLRGRGWIPRHSSAKSGEGVEEAFQSLASRMLAAKP
jgi:GTPase SAR1 family protein